MGVLRLQHASESPGGLVKTQIAGSTPSWADLMSLGWVQESAFPTSCQVILMLPIGNHTLRTIGRRCTYDGVQVLALKEFKDIGRKTRRTHEKRKVCQVMKKRCSMRVRVTQL